MYTFIFLLSLKATPDTMESELSNGLVIGHAYSITMVTQVCSFHGLFASPY